MNVETTFVTAPPLLILEFSNSEIEIDHCHDIKRFDETHKYDLAGVIYYRDEHFISNIIILNIITTDKQVWFYDGLATGSQLIYSGSLQSCPQLSVCRGGMASAAFYTHA